jgi:hypothetical protein
VTVPSFFSPYFRALLVFLAASAFFLLFRSQQYTAVDGALRSLEVYRRPAVSFHENNHLLYPANVFLWTATLKSTGFRAGDSQDFIRLSQAMNCVAAGGCLAALYLLTWFATSSAVISFCAVIGYGFTRAFLLHATNAAEPMVGLFYSFLAMLITVECLRRGRVAMLLFAGVLFALAMASYQSMILAAPLAAFLCLGWPRKGDASVAVRLTALLGGAAAGIAAIYGYAYWREGARDLAQMTRMFFGLVGGADTYAGYKTYKLVNLPAGFVGNVLPALPRDYAGIRALLSRNTMRQRVWVFVCTGAILAVLAALPSIRSISRPRRLLTLALAVTLALVGWPLLYWDSIYDKLWLQPLALIVFLIALLCATDRPAYWRGWLRCGLVAFFVFEITANMVWLVRDHFQETQGLKEASIVAADISPRDKVVLDFDVVSSLYYAFWGVRENVLLLPASQRQKADQWMLQAIANCRQNGGSVYFLGVLDQSEPVWDAFLGRRVGIPYDTYASYRAQAQIVETFKLRNAVVTLRRLKVE